MCCRWLSLPTRLRPTRRTPALGDYERRIAARFRIGDRGGPADRWLLDTVRFAWRTKILLSLSVDVRTRLRQSAERDAAAVFAANLKDLLLAAPAGSRATLGLDPGFRTGVKVAVVDATGKVVAHDTIYPHQPVNKWDQSLSTLQTAGAGARRRAGRNRQRHRVQGDRPAGNRSHGALSRV